MLLCGFHWHSRYSIWISTFILIDSMCFRAIPCGSQGVPVTTRYQMNSDVMIIGLYYQK